MNILVTGGAGFIGSNFTLYLLDKYPSYNVYCLDQLTYAGNLSNLESVFGNDKFTFIKGDIADTVLINNLFNERNINVVVNFAAESHVDRSISGPAVFLRTNYMGVFNLLEIIRKYPSVRFHQVSTDEVFGDLPLERPDLQFTESTCMNPSSPYSATKAAADMLIHAYHRTYGLNVTTSHASNNYGPYQFPEKLIPLAIHRAMDNKSIPVYGTGLNVRDWIHVFDHCSALDKIIHYGKAGESYNIGGSNEMTNLAVVRLILELLGKPENLIVYVKDRAGHDLRYAIDSSKMKNDFDWQTSIEFEIGLKETINWYKLNAKWVASIINKDYQEYFKQQYE
jgi:dTDP-glucose 4,6-dehydratase